MRRRRHPVVLEDRLEARRQRPAAAAFELVGRCRQIVRAQNGRHPAERPERALHAGDQRLEGLAEGDHHPAPAARTQHELEEQMAEQLSRDRDAELGGMREIDRRLAPGLMHLLEEDFLGGPVECAPVAHPALQSPERARGVALGPLRGEHVEHRRRLEDALGILDQQRHDRAVPDLRERIPPGPPAARRLGRRRQRPVLPVPRRPHAHPRGGRRGLLRLAFHALLPQHPDLPVRDHRPLPGAEASHRPSGRTRPAKVIVVDRQKQLSLITAL